MRTRQLKQKEIKDVRQKILEEQNYICPICTNPIGELDAMLDHEHKKRVGGTGLIRGVLCRSCNVFVGKIENNCKRYGFHIRHLPRALRRISKYLKKDHLPLRHPSERKKGPKLKKDSYNRLMKAYCGMARFPEYPKSGKLTVKLKELFNLYGIKPEFYK